MEKNRRASGVDITGQVFGALTAISRTLPNVSHRRMWLCKCECGIEKQIAQPDLIGGRIKSCGYLSSKLKAESMKSRWQDPEAKTLFLEGSQKGAQNNRAKAINRDLSIQESDVQECAKCKIKKPLDEFPAGRKNRRGAPRYSYCKTCHGEYQRVKRLKNFFNITPEEYELILKHQGGVCFICKLPPKSKRLAIDHNHKTGLIRGLLCFVCNKSMGPFRDDVEKFKNIVEYLQNPPASVALGKPRFGLKGKTSNKAATRKRLNASEKPLL